MFKTLKLRIKTTVDPESIMQALIEFGYRLQESVSEEGDLARRGGIIDVFPFTFELPVRVEFNLDEITSIKTFNPLDGKLLWAHHMAVILPLKKPYTFKNAACNEDSPIDNFLDLNIGDYAVHTHHGLARFMGFKKNYLVLEYDRQEKLYVSDDHAHLVQKYISFYAKRPRLSRLGGKEWLKVKERTKNGIRKFAWELLSLQALRSSITRPAYLADNDWQKQFEGGFAYKETPDQEKATAEVKKDMESRRPMDRLLCGDVGYGKTEVAMRAAFKAVISGKQVAYLVPTTILAEQHYQNFSLRLGVFPLNIQMLCRFKTQAEQKKIIQGIAEGAVDIVIGTHRLLSEDIKFKNPGLVIIDEEQRFGVKAKEKLKAMKLTTDVLTLTATPIPRTLYMGLMSAKDLSVINTPPQERLSVKTVVAEYDGDLIKQAVARELSRKGQVYFVHNRIQDIEKVKENVSQALPADVRFAIAHGQMSAKILERVMFDFLKGDIDVLVSTMIIESGIDIPNANTIIINNAHRFGLSDLHQLRGRVGRFNRLAYAYLLIPRREAVDTQAKKRLDAILKYSHLGAGFKIAMEDLETRGAGNLLGVQQHGFVAAVGFDLYLRLLREAVGAFGKVGIPNG